MKDELNVSIDEEEITFDLNHFWDYVEANGLNKFHGSVLNTDTGATSDDCGYYDLETYILLPYETIKKDVIAFVKNQKLF